MSQVGTDDVCFLNSPVTDAVFNDRAVIVGQRIFITFNATVFFNLTGLNPLQSTTPAIAFVTRGLLLKDPVSGNPELYAGWVATAPQSN